MGRGTSKAGAGNTSGTPVTRRFESLPETSIQPMRPTRRAQEVFDREYTEARRTARTWIERGEYNEGNRMQNLYASDTEPTFSLQAIRGIQALINSEWRGLNVDEELGVSSRENNQVRRYALILMQNTLNYHYDFYNEIHGR